LSIVSLLKYHFIASVRDTGCRHTQVSLFICISLLRWDI